MNVTTWRNPCINFDKSTWQLWEIHVTTLTNQTIWIKFNKATDGQNDKARQWPDLGPIKCKNTNNKQAIYCPALVLKDITLEISYISCQPAGIYLPDGSESFISIIEWSKKYVFLRHFSLPIDLCAGTPQREKIHSFLPPEMEKMSQGISKTK